MWKINNRETFIMHELVSNLILHKLMKDHCQQELLYTATDMVLPLFGHPFSRFLEIPVVDSCFGRSIY